LENLFWVREVGDEPRQPPGRNQDFAAFCVNAAFQVVDGAVYKKSLQEPHSADLAGQFVIEIESQTIQSLTILGCG
jgi:hypothetical protein